MSLDEYILRNDTSYKQHILGIWWQGAAGVTGRGARNASPSERISENCHGPNARGLVPTRTAALCRSFRIIAREKK